MTFQSPWRVFLTTTRLSLQFFLNILIAMHSFWSSTIDLKSDSQHLVTAQNDLNILFQNFQFLSKSKVELVVEKGCFSDYEASLQLL